MMHRETSDPLMDAIEGWTKVSDYLYTHSSGARIERKGFPARPGWYLSFAGERTTVRRFEPSPRGCDQAFVAFAGKRAAVAYLSRILKAG
jgi:hypothetical protein